MCVGIFYEVLVHFNTLRLLAHLDKGTDINTFTVELNNIVGSVHVNEDIFVTELVVFISHHVVHERLFRSTKMAPQDHELSLVLQISLRFGPKVTLGFATSEGRQVTSGLNLFLVQITQDVYAIRAKIAREFKQETSVNCVLTTKFVRRVNCYPLLGVLQV